MKLIEYFFYGIALCCFWILPGRALENGGLLSAASPSPPQKTARRFYLTIRKIWAIITMR